MRRKIDDIVLLEMLKQGKLQKEIAEHFGVSPVAICKRLKRLLPQPESVLDKYSLTDQQKQFVIEKAKGKTNIQAVMASYEVSSRVSAKVIGSQLMNMPKVKMSLSELHEIHLPQDYKIMRLRTHADNVDPMVSLKALDLSWKLDGSYAPEKHINLNVHYDALTKEEAESDAKIAELKRRLAALGEDDPELREDENEGN